MPPWRLYTIYTVMQIIYSSYDYRTRAASS